MSVAPANPLHPIHQHAEAEFQPYADVEIVCTFGEPQAEYSAIRKGCGLMDFPQRGLLEVGGKDRLEFLNRFLTNDLLQKDKTVIVGGQGCYAFLLNNKGRIVAEMNVIERGDRTLLETDARNVENLQTTLGKYVFSEKVEFASLVGKWHQMALHGPKSAEILGQIAGAPPLLRPGESTCAALFDIPDVIIWRDDPCGVPGYFLLMPVEFAHLVWERITSRFGSGDPTQTQSSKRQVWPLGWAAFNATRIEAGRAMFGIDFDETVLPAETGQLDRAVSFTKGCYLGQEIVARMHARNQTPRLIVGIRMNNDALPIAGAPVYDEQKNQVGQITSSTMSPVLSNAAICLAMMKKQFTAPGAVVSVAAEGGIHQGTVTALPFIQPKTEDPPLHV